MPNRSLPNIRRTASTSRRRTAARSMPRRRGRLLATIPPVLMSLLLEELGVDFEDIWSKTKLVLTPSFRAVDERLVEGSDLAGPAVFALLLAGALVLRGKLHFGYVWVWIVFLCCDLRPPQPDASSGSVPVAQSSVFWLLFAHAVLLAAASIVVSSRTSRSGQELGGLAVLASTCTSPPGCSRRSCRQDGCPARACI